MKLQKKKISELKPASYNPRKISDEALAGLEKSLGQFGYLQPIIWNKRSQNVVGGHQRLKVLEKQQQKEVDVVVVDLDEIQEKALNISLNNPEIQGMWNYEKLEIILDELKLDLPEYGELRMEELKIIKPAQLPAQENDDNSHVKSKTECPNCGAKF
jgi:ParB-like chromosome segregation protein Spo0J